MKVSAKTEYACIAVMELAAGYQSGEPVRIRSIAQRHGIPSRFLVQILLQLKGAGLVASTRGAAGGYRLVRPPDEITLGGIMAVIEGPEEPVASSAAAKTPEVGVLLSIWQEISDVQREMLERVTLAELVEQCRAREEDMYYI